VNQVGYVSGPVRAYVMASGDEAGGQFEVLANGAVILTGVIGSSLGPWSSSFPFVHSIDFSLAGGRCVCSIRVTGPIPASSPEFRVDSGARLYRTALANTLSFLENERDGPRYIPSALRSAPAHLNDQDAMTYRTPRVDENGAFEGDLSPLGVRLDASGGWWDAGDYLKFVQTTSYTASLLLLGVRDFPDLMGAGSMTSDYTAEARFATDWLLRMWDDPTRTLYYQVGIGSGNRRIIGDHDLWRLPQDDDTFGGTNPAFRYIRNRPVFRAGPPGSPISPNLAGRLAATFGLCAQVFRTVDADYADRCLLAGEHVFELADTRPEGNLLTVIPFDFYPEVEWRDDLELGAVELSLALAAGTPTEPARLAADSYLALAAHWARAYINGPDDAADTLNLYDVTGIGHADLYRALGAARTPPLEITQDQLLADLRKQLDGALAQGAGDPFGFGFPWNAYDSTSHGAGLSVMASLYDAITGSARYAEPARRWLANILGANPWGSSFIVGDGTTFPHCMQHQVANLVGSLDGSSPILAGAAVEGPNYRATKGKVEGMRACPPGGEDVFAPFNGTGVYMDDVQSYSTVEPAHDLTASSPLAFAWQSASPAW
jgi:endoglucanase